MKNNLPTLVIYFSIVGSFNLVDSVTGAKVSAVTDYTTAEHTETVASATQTSSASSVSYNSVSSSTTSSTVSTKSATTTVQPVTSSVTTVALGSSGKSFSTTTTSPGPWRDVAISLALVCGVMFLALTITILILCKMRSKLGQASKTLYPITTSPESNEYLDIESGTQKKYKKGVKVELTNITPNTEEEFDSPTFPPTPPVKPKRSNPPPVPSSQPPAAKVSDEAPQLPSRSNSKVPLSSKENISGKSTKEQARLQKSGSNPMFGETNRGFEPDMTNSGDGNGIINLHDDDDDMYESYEHGYTGNLAFGADDFDDTDIQTPYEEPVKSSVGNLIQRQGSSTGLPEMAIQRISSKEQMQDVPLHEAEEDEEFDAEGFGTVDPDSGLPDMTGMTNIDDLQYFDDPDAMTTQANDTNEDTDELHNKEHERQDAPSPTADSLDDLLTYDDADMVLGNIDENQGDDNEPGFYEDFDMGENNVVQANMQTKSENIETDVSELPKVPPRRKSTIDKTKRSVEDTKIKEVTSRSESVTEAGGAVPDITGLPSVPLRRDLLRKQSETENADDTSNDLVPKLESPPAVNMDTFPGELVLLRTGSKIEENSNERPRDSYFLDVMDENPVELSDNSSNKVLSEMSNGNAHLSEFGENYTDFE